MVFVNIILFDCCFSNNEPSENTNVSNPLIAHIAITNVSEKRTYMFIIFMDTRNIDVFFRGYSQIPF